MSAADNRVETGDGLDALRRRMSADERFRYRRHELFVTVFTTPLTVEMVLGDRADALRAIVTAVRELHGDDVELTLDTDGGGVIFAIRKWRDEGHLRSLDKQEGGVV